MIHVFKITGQLNSVRDGLFKFTYGIYGMCLKLYAC